MEKKKPNVYEGLFEVKKVLKAQGVADEVIVEAATAYLYAIELVDEGLHTALMAQLIRERERGEYFLP